MENYGHISILLCSVGFRISPRKLFIINRSLIQTPTISCRLVNLASGRISPPKQLPPFFMEEIRRNMDNGLLKGAAFNDLKKLNDTIAHHIPLKSSRDMTFATGLFFCFLVICEAVPNMQKLTKFSLPSIQLRSSPQGHRGRPSSLFCI